MHDIQLRDYYQNAMGQLDHNQKLEAQDRIKEEERKTMLQTSVRVVAGQLDDIKTSYSNLKLLMIQMREAFVPTARALSTQGMDVEGEASEDMEEEEDAKHVKEKDGFNHAAVAIAGSVEAVCDCAWVWEWVWVYIHRHTHTHTGEWQAGG